MNIFSRFLCVVIAGSSILWGSSATAETKIGVVNTGRVIQEAPQAQDASKRLEQEFAPREQALVEAQNAVKKNEERLSRDAAVMSETEQRKLERDILAGKRDLKRSQDEFREDLNIRRNEEFGKLQRLVSQIIVDLAKEKKYDLILGDNVIFAGERVDITDEVLEQLQRIDSSATKNNTTVK